MYREEATGGVHLTQSINMSAKSANVVIKNDFKICIME